MLATPYERLANRAKMLSSSLPRALRGSSRALSIAIERDANDRVAFRDGGRAAFALGKHELAADLFSRAVGLLDHPMPSCFIYGRIAVGARACDAAKATHQRMLSLLGPAPAQRIEKLWAREVYARLGDLATADAIYEGLTMADPGGRRGCARCAPRCMRAHATGSAAEHAIRGLLARDPSNKRGNEMLAWIYEARGRLADEIAVRETLIGRRGPSVTNVRDYGRALERSGDWAAALNQYRRAATRFRMARTT